MTRLAPGREQEIRERLALPRWDPRLVLDGGYDSATWGQVDSLLVELDALRADLAAAAKVAEAARALTEVLEAREGSEEWAAFTALLLALAACPVPTSEGGKG